MLSRCHSGVPNMQICGTFFALAARMFHLEESGRNLIFCTFILVLDQSCRIYSRFPNLEIKEEKDLFGGIRKRKEFSFNLG